MPRSGPHHHPSLYLLRNQLRIAIPMRRTCRSLKSRQRVAWCRLRRRLSKVATREVVVERPVEARDTLLCVDVHMVVLNVGLMLTLIAVANPCAEWLWGIANPLQNPLQIPSPLFEGSNIAATTASSSQSDEYFVPSIAQSLDRSVGSGATCPIPRVDPQGLATETSGVWSGPRAVTWLPDYLPEQLQVLMRTSGLPRAAVYGSRLVQNLSEPPRWSLEMSVDISEREGDALLGSLLTDRMESPDWEARSDENRAD